MYSDLPEVPGHTGDQAVYFLRVLPHDDIEVKLGSIARFPGIGDWCYNSLPIGVYHYYFGLNLDYLKYYDGTYTLSHQPYPNEWGVGSGTDTEGMLNTPSYGLDPSLSRHVTYGPRVNSSESNMGWTGVPDSGGKLSYNEIDRLAGRLYTSDGVNTYDATTFLDRPVPRPGVANPNDSWTYEYPESCT